MMMMMMEPGMQKRVVQLTDLGALWKLDTSLADDLSQTELEVQNEVLSFYKRKYYIKLHDLNIMYRILLFLFCSLYQSHMETCASKEEGWGCMQ